MIRMLHAANLHRELWFAVSFCIAVIILVWPFATSYPPPAAAISHDSKIEVQIKEGCVSVYADNSALRDILLRISEEAGIKMVLYGGLKTPVTQSFSGVSLIAGIRRLAGTHSVAILHQVVDEPGALEVLQNIAEVWVLDNDGSASEAEIADSEPKKFKIDLIVDLPESSPRIDASQSNTSDWREAILSRQEFEEDTEVGYWANILVTSHDRDIRVQAVTELERIGSDDAVAAIAIVFGDEDALLRRHAVESLGNIDNDHTAPLLGQALIGDKDLFVRMTAANIFAGQRNEISQAFLTTALMDPDKRIKTLASKALSAFDDPN